MKSRKIKYVLLICAIPLMIYIAMDITGLSKYLIFRIYVLNPIPKSVADIKVDQQGRIFGEERCVFYFKISKDDVKLILKSRDFKECENVRFVDKQSLWWDSKYSTDNDGDLALYWQKEPPEWFRPNDWTDPKVYCFEEKWGKAEYDHVKVLIYNEDLEEAYFIECCVGD